MTRLSILPFWLWLSPGAGVERFNSDLIGSRWSRGVCGEQAAFVGQLRSRLCYRMNTNYFPLSHTSQARCVWGAVRPQGRIFCLFVSSTFISYVACVAEESLCFWCSPMALSWTGGGRVTLVRCRGCQRDYGNSQHPPLPSTPPPSQPSLPIPPHSQLFLGDTELTSSTTTPCSPADNNTVDDEYFHCNAA